MENEKWGKGKGGRGMENGKEGMGMGNGKRAVGNGEGGMRNRKQKMENWD